jgi:hypothetical protein
LFLPIGYRKNEMVHAKNVPLREAMLTKWLNLSIFVEYKETIWRLYDCIYLLVWWGSLELWILNLVLLYLIALGGCEGCIRHFGLVAWREETTMKT